MPPAAAVSPLWRPDEPVSKDTGKDAVGAQHIEQAEDDSTLKTVDEILRRRARTNPDLPVVSYPSSGIEYVDYTFQQLDVFAYRVGKQLQAVIPSRASSEEKRTVVAMLGPSNLEYLVTMMGLFKLGHTVLFLSTRISVPAIESLITSTGATYLIADPRYLDASLATKAQVPGLQVLDMPTRTNFEFPIDAVGDTQLDAALDPSVETNQIVYIIHSSGSTGLPKAIYQKQNAALSNFSGNMNMKAFITLPLYHNHGICNLYRAVWSKKAIHLYNADLPLTCNHLIKTFQAHDFEIFYGVPYALKLLAEADDGLSLLAQLKIVMYGGSACPDDLGDLLVENGVNLVGHYGATEVGQLMTSFRGPGDKAWNYVREHDKLKPYLRWIPQGPNLYECCVLPGWPAKTSTNMDDGSYRTKDLFEPHPSVAGAWKYIARQDDTIVLVNGEKCNPVVTEGKIRSSKLVTEAVVFGAQQPYLGVLVVPSPAAALGKSPAEILDLVWPVVEASQESNDAFAKLSREMVVVLPYDVDYPRTDKGSLIRQAFYKVFAKEIELAYEISSSTNENAQEYSKSELRDFLRGMVTKALPQGSTFTDETDFFSLGLDSLQSIQIRAEILRSVRTANKLTQNVVFDHPSIDRLAAYLSGSSTQTSVEDEIASLVEKYSKFSAPKSKPGRFVAVTGSTGSLGAHIVAQLVQDPSIDRIYCFVRAKDESSAAKRTAESLILRKLYHSLPLQLRRKVISLPVDLSKPDLGLPEQTYREITSSLRTVIHAAWSVNFNIRLSSFEKDNIAGVRHLIDLCQSAGSGASFNFCSSVSTVARHPDEAGPVPESLPDAKWAQGMGYAQSKCVAEAVCARAAERAGIPVRVLRIGQIVADTAHGVWNATEAVPLMLQSALTIGALPRLSETPSWLPVDTVAKGVAEIALSDASDASAGGAVFANVVNHRTFSWTNDLLPALRAAGLDFEEVEPKEWVKRLRESNPDPVVNPPIKLVDFFASKYDRGDFSPSKQYVTDTARSLSQTLENAPLLDSDFAKKFVDQFCRTSWEPSTAPKDTEPASPAKRVIIVTGPCGSGKTTLATALASETVNAPFIEGDSLHSKDAVDRMHAGQALSDEHRKPWLARLVRRTEEELFELGYDTVVASCSGLKRSYRDRIREIGAGGRAKVVFLDLQCAPETLIARLEGRKGHYMKAEMVESQLAAQESVAVDEADVFPIDAEGGLGAILKEATWALERIS
ncbi:putative NRPS-like protein biosynthetic cluster [Diaporthe australafricana]|uniref:gluconokinase n=1 Tax=Diaporthe australafricana TaxID=127596 RepID=A0ABR3W9A5_9PEZI